MSKNRLILYRNKGIKKQFKINTFQILKNVTLLYAQNTALLLRTEKAKPKLGK